MPGAPETIQPISEGFTPRGRGDLPQTPEKSNKVEIEEKLRELRRTEENIKKELGELDQDINRLKHNYREFKRSKVTQVINYFGIKKLEDKFERLLKSKLLTESKLREVRKKISDLEGKL